MKKKDTYFCMVCKKFYTEGDLPTKDKGDGCCTIGSLIETGTGLLEQMENAKAEEYTSLSDEKALEIIEKFIKELSAIPKKDEKI